MAFTTNGVANIKHIFMYERKLKGDSGFDMTQLFTKRPASKMIEAKIFKIKKITLRNFLLLLKSEIHISMGRAINSKT